MTVQSIKDFKYSLPTTQVVSLIDLLPSLPALPTLQLEFDPALATLWVTMRNEGKGCLTAALIRDFNRLAETIRLELGRAYPAPDQPVKFVVLKSASPKVFNLGGDLDLFVEAIASRDGEALDAYGRAGAESCRALASGFDASLVTISLVRGLAIGGGFEAARCCDLLVAEDGASFQLPEANFGLFAASGVMSVIAPRVGHAAIRRLVIDGEKLDCAAAKAMDLVDEVATTGAGEAAVRALIARLTPRHAAAVATYRGLNRLNGVTGEALRAEAHFWARSAMSLSPENLAMMRRLSRAQAKRFATNDHQGADRCQ